jgi:hypothetical protein
VSGVFPMDSQGFKAMEEERNKQRNGLNGKENGTF